MSSEISDEPRGSFPSQEPSILERISCGEEDRAKQAEKVSSLDKEGLEAKISILNNPALNGLIEGGRICFGVIKPDVHHSKPGVAGDVAMEEELLGYICQKKRDTKLRVLFAVSLSPTRKDLEVYYKEERLRSLRRENGSAWDEIVKEYGSGPLTYFLLYSPKGNAVEEWKNIIGAPDSAKADGNSGRGKFVLKFLGNLIHDSLGNTKKKNTAKVRRRVDWLRDKLVDLQKQATEQNSPFNT